MAMEGDDFEEEEEFGFSRNYFISKELGSSRKKSARKLSDINLVDEEVHLYLSLYILCVCDVSTCAYA